MARVDVLARQVAEIDAEVVQVDEANLTGHPYNGVWAFEPINRVVDAVRCRRLGHRPFTLARFSERSRKAWRTLCSTTAPCARADCHSIPLPYSLVEPTLNCPIYSFPHARAYPIGPLPQRSHGEPCRECRKWRAYLVNTRRSVRLPARLLFVLIYR
jgi:hypothetical protein